MDKGLFKPSRLIAGTMNWGSWGAGFKKPDYIQMIRHCLYLGIDSFDLADIYGDYTTEEEFGDALHEMGIDRLNLKLITKAGIRIISPNRPGHRVKSYDTSARHIIETVEQSLQNLQTDYLDLFLLHRPDPLLDPHEVAEAFTSLRKAGKVLYFGVSNFSPSQTTLLHSFINLSAHQLELSITHLNPFLDGTLDQCIIHQMIPLAWSPLGGGNIFSSTVTDERIKRITAMASVMAEKYSCTPDLVLLSWLLLHPSHIHPVLGTSKQERIRAACEALEIEISREDWFFLWRASTGKEVD